MIILNIQQEDNDTGIKAADYNGSSMESIITSKEDSKTSSSITISQSELIVDKPIDPSSIDDFNTTKEAKRKRKIRVGAMMCIAYASNIGGTASLIGSGAQLALKGILLRYIYAFFQ